MTQMVATQSTSIRLPNGHMQILNPGDLVEPEVLGLMSDDHRSRTVAEWDGTETPLDEEVEPGTSDDSRLVGAPNTNAKVPAILKWVGTDLVRAEAIYERELRRTKPRPTLMNPIAELLDAPREDPPNA